MTNKHLKVLFNPLPTEFWVTDPDPIFEGSDPVKNGRVQIRLFLNSRIRVQIWIYDKHRIPVKTLRILLIRAVGKGLSSYFRSNGYIYCVSHYYLHIKLM